MQAHPILAGFFGFFALVVLADEKPTESLDEALEMSTSLNIQLESLESTLIQLKKQVQTDLPNESTLDFDIKILTRDLQLEGFTQNQRIRNFQHTDQPLRAILTALLLKANGNPSSTDPSAPVQRLVWLVGPDPQNSDRQVILITTRPMAKQRSDRLPDEFREVPPTLQK